MFAGNGIAVAEAYNIENEAYKTARTNVIILFHTWKWMFIILPITLLASSIKEQRKKFCSQFERHFCQIDFSSKTTVSMLQLTYISVKAMKNFSQLPN